MKRLLSILFLVPLLTSAQKEAEVFCTNNYEGSGIRVKWLYRTVYHPSGFNVYRQEQGTNSWDKLNSSPVSLQRTIPNGLKLDQEAIDLHKATLNTPFDEFSEAIVRAFVLIKAIYAEPLAQVLGIAYVDLSAVQGKTYVYKLELAQGNKELNVSKPILCAPYLKNASPQDVKLKRYKKRVDMQWKPEIYRYYAVDVYRKKDDESEYNRITPVPRAIQKEQADAFSEKAVFYQDTAIDYNANYMYKFVAIDYFGQESEFSVEYAVPAADFIPPQPPFNVIPTASALNANIRLDWKVIDEADLAGCNVYISTDPDAEFTRVNKELIPKGTETYLISSLTPNGYYIVVSTVDKAGNETPGGTVFSDVRDVIPPAAPANLKAEAGEGFIRLSWDANREPDLAGYFIQRANLQGETPGAYINVNKSPITEAKYEETLPKNVRNKFVYRVIAVDTNFNRSNPSNNSLAQMPDVVPPQTPLIKSIVSDTTQAVVAWLPNVESDLKGYNIYRSLENDSLNLQKVNFQITPSNVSQYTDRNVKPGAAYVYYVEAVDDAGNVSLKSVGFRTKIPQAKPTGVLIIEKQRYNAKKKTLNLEWSANVNGEIKGYVIYAAPNGEVPSKPLTGLIAENYYKLALDVDVPKTMFIKCYTASGTVVQSEVFNLLLE